MLCYTIDMARGSVMLFKEDHGKRYTYLHYECRCSLCVEANAAYQRKRGKMQKKNIREVPHGTRNAYSNYGCRCKACTKANTKYHRQLREKRILSVNKGRCPACGRKLKK